MELMEFIEHNWFPITLLISIVSFTIKITNIVKNYDLKFKELKSDMQDFKEDTNTKFQEINDKFDDNFKDKEDDKERTRLIMQGVEATLISLKNDGHNGPVTTSLQEINDYKTRKAAE